MKKLSKVITVFLNLAMTCSIITGIPVSAATPNGYGVDLSYELASLPTLNGTFSTQNIRRVFNSIPEGKVMNQAWSAVESSSVVTNDTVGWTNGSATYTYSGGASAGTMSYNVTSEANRTTDGTYGLKFDLSNAGDRTGLAIITATKSSIGTITGTSRDIYVSFWIKAINRDGTTSYSSYVQPTTNTAAYAKAPVSIALCNNHTMFAVLTENNCVEKETSDGWRKLSYVIPAANTTDLRLKLFVRQSISSEYAVTDRQTLYIDDLYITEVPSSIEWANSSAVNSGSTSIALSNYSISAASADGNYSDITSNNKLEYVVVGDAHIDNGNLIYDGSASGNVIVNAKMLGEETAEKTFNFTVSELPALVSANITEIGSTGAYAISLTNNDTVEHNAVVFIVAYNSNATQVMGVVEAETADAIVSGGTATLTTSVLNTRNVTSPVIKTYIWASKSSIMPLSSPITLVE